MTPELITEPVALAEVLRRMLAANPAISMLRECAPAPVAGRTPKRWSASGAVDSWSSGSAWMGRETVSGELHHTTAKFKFLAERGIVRLGEHLAEPAAPSPTPP